MKTLDPEDLNVLRRLTDRLVATTISKGFREPPPMITHAVWESEALKPVRVAIFTANLHGETSELWEAARKGQLDKPCDKTPGLTCAEEEIADIIIRALDLAHFLKVDPARAIALKAEYNESRPFRHGGKLL